MKKHYSFKNIIFLLLTIIVACGCEKDDKPLKNVFQTQWKGTLSNQETVYDIVVAFDFETTGYYVIGDESFGFSYYQNNKLIQISGAGDNAILLDGAWMIDKLTISQFKLVSDPFVESRRRVLNLNIIKSL